MISQEAPKRLLPAIIAIAVVVAILWIFLVALRP
jgi:hypothetical protein